MKEWLLNITPPLPLGLQSAVIFVEDFFVSLHLVTTSQETRFIAITVTVYKLTAEREGLITRRKLRVNELISWHVCDNSCLFPGHRRDLRQTKYVLDRVAQIPGARKPIWLDFFRWRLIFVTLQYLNCFMSPLWWLTFWGWLPDFGGICAYLLLDNFTDRFLIYSNNVSTDQRQGSSRTSTTRCVHIHIRILT